MITFHNFLQSFHKTALLLFSTSPKKHFLFLPIDHFVYETKKENNKASSQNSPFLNDFPHQSSNLSLFSIFPFHKAFYEKQTSKAIQSKTLLFIKQKIETKQKTLNPVFIK